MRISLYKDGCKKVRNDYHMKYFFVQTEVDFLQIENYIEFCPPNAAKELGDEKSLYMHEMTMNETGFDEFWCECMRKDLVFDMDTISKEDLEIMINEAIKHGSMILDILMELKLWSDTYFSQGDQLISINRKFDYFMECCREQCESYTEEKNDYSQWQVLK